LSSSVPSAVVPSGNVTRKGAPGTYSPSAPSRKNFSAALLFAGALTVKVRVTLKWRVH
jgi:hypothetical protein